MDGQSFKASKLTEWVFAVLEKKNSRINSEAIIDSEISDSEISDFNWTHYFISNEKNTPYIYNFIYSLFIRYMTIIRDILI